MRKQAAPQHRASSLHSICTVFAAKLRHLATAYNYMRLVDVSSDLRAISFLHYEQLAGTNGMSSIRVVNGMVERILFREVEGGISITVLSLDDTHYGNKK